MTIRIIHGDCVEMMKTLPDCSVDAVVTDPPYGIRFMGQAWDGADIEQRASDRRNCPSKYLNAGPNGGHNSLAAEAGKYDLTSKGMLAFQDFSEAWAREALRVLKPGGYLLSFSSPRTFHRMVCGIEAAGFEIRDQIMWVFGSGFPKSHNGEWGGTALKPAHEPITVARKPLVGTVEANWREHGTGALNIDACRIQGKPRTTHAAGNFDTAQNAIYGRRAGGQLDEPDGRWPANLIHDGSAEVVAAFPDAPGQLVDASSSSSARNSQNVYGAMTRGNGRENEPSGDAREDTGFRMKPGARRADAGSAARFFYCAKATASDRNEGLEGLEGLEGRVTDDGREVPADNAYQRGKSLRQNFHPTVKPTDLMRYLCRLVTPAGGVVLDPFMGSGSTLKAAELEGFSAIGIELDADYIAIARRRIAADAPLFADVTG